MYAIYGNIYRQYTPNVSIYTSTMDPMGSEQFHRNLRIVGSEKNMEKNTQSGIRIETSANAG